MQHVFEEVMMAGKAYLPATEQAAGALGAQIAVARRELGWTQDELASRLGTTRQLVARIERGSTGVAVGTVLEAAILCAVRLFDSDRTDLANTVERERTRVALLPTRVRARAPVVNNDF